MKWENYVILLLVGLEINVYYRSGFLKITKVDGFSFERNSIEGNICKDGKSHLVCDINHSNYDSVLTRDLRKVLVKGVKGNHKGNNHKEKNEVRKINSRREAVKKILKNIRVVNGKVSLKNNEINNVNVALDKLVSDKKDTKLINIKDKEISYEEIISYNFKRKSNILFGNNIHNTISELVDIKTNNGCVEENDIIKIFEKYDFNPYDFIDEEAHKTTYEKWNISVQKSINNNKIIIESDYDSNENISSRQDFRIYCSSLLSSGINDYNEFMDKLRYEYNLHELLIKIRSKLSSEKKNIDKQKKRTKSVVYYKNNIIKKTLIDFQYNNKKLLEARSSKSELKYYDEEVTSYFHKYYPVKKSKGKKDTKINDEILLSTNKIHDYVKNKIISKSINSSIKTGYYKNVLGENIESVNNICLEKAHLEEVFLRKLSSTITYAANTFRNEIKGRLQLNSDSEFSNLCVNVLGFNILRKEENEELRNQILYKLHSKSESEAISIINKTIEELNNNMEILSDFDIEFVVDDNFHNNINKLMTRIETLYKNYIEKIKCFNINTDFLGDEKLESIFKILYSTSGCTYFDDIEVYSYFNKWIYLFRNPVFHFNNEIEESSIALNDAFTKLLIEDFSYRVDSIPLFEINKLYSNSVFKHFDFEKVMKLYEENDLFKQLNDTKVPSFRNIIKSYRNVTYFMDEIDEKEREIVETLIKLDKIIESANESSKYLARKYLIKRIYSCNIEDLVKYVVENSEVYYKKKIKESTDSDKYINIKKATRLKGSYRYRYSELKKAIQRDIDIQRQKDRDLSSGFAFDMEKELFSMGLLNLLKKEEFSFIFEENCDEYNFKEEEVIKKFEVYWKDKPVIDIKLNIDKNNTLMYPLYGVLNLLSKSRLSELYSNILSYKQAIDEFGLSKKLFETGKYYINIDDFFTVISVMMQTYEKFTYVDNGLKEENYLEILKEFIDFDEKQDLGEFNKLLIGDCVRDQLYIQNDNKSLVYFSQIIEASKENLLEKYRLYYEENKITKEQVSEFALMELNIEGIIKEKETLKNKMRKVSNKKFDETDVNKYTELNNEILKYNRLKNRLLLNDMSKMNRLLIDLYSRYTSLLSVFEKNLYILFSQEGIILANKENIFTKFAKESSNNKIKNIREYFYQEKDFNNTIRNNFAHFHYLRGTGDTEGITFIEQLNELRYLLSMDRKLKNAVTKVAINVFKKHGFELSFRFENHKITSFEIKRVKSNDIYINGIDIDAGQDYFLDMINQVVFKNV